MNITGERWGGSHGPEGIWKAYKKPLDTKSYPRVSERDWEGVRQEAAGGEPTKSRRILRKATRDARDVTIYL
jgi:hypothetical protein